MVYCIKCGKQMEDEARFCPSCGQPVNKANAGQGAEAVFEKVTNTEDTTSNYTPEEIQNGKAMSILAYLGILVLIPFLAEKNNKFVRYHVNQGIVLLIAEIIFYISLGVLSSVIMAISWHLYFIVEIARLFGLVFLAYLILGIVNVVNGKAKELPLIGRIKILN